MVLILTELAPRMQSVSFLLREPFWGASAVARRRTGLTDFGANSHGIGTEVLRYFPLLRNAYAKMTNSRPGFFLIGGTLARVPRKQSYLILKGTHKKGLEIANRVGLVQT